MLVTYDTGFPDWRYLWEKTVKFLFCRPKCIIDYDITIITNDTTVTSTTKSPLPTNLWLMVQL